MSLFVIQSLPRSGTHFLRTALNSHGDMWCYAEVFNPNWRDRHPANVPPVVGVENIIEHCRAQPRPTGFIAHAYVGLADQEVGLGLGATFRHRKSDVRAAAGLWQVIPPQTPVITLWRENLLAQYVSKILARRSGSWLVYEHQPTMPPTTRIDVDCRQMLSDFVRMRSLTSIAQQRFPHAYRVSYETLTEECDRIFREIQIYLAVEPRQLVPQTLKMGRPLQETISNLREVEACLEGTPYARFLQDMR